MELYYYKLFNPHLKIIDKQIDKNTDIYSIESFYRKYKYFDYKEFIKLNRINVNMRLIDTMIYYHINYVNKNLLASVKDFYIKYPNFDISFYKKVYNLKFNSDIEYLIHYHNIGINENKIYSINNFKEKYNYDINFIKSFYNYFENKSELDIIINILNSIDIYILSNEHFNKKFPEFSIKIYKLFNNININDNIKCKSIWYHNDMNLNKIYSVNTFLKLYSDFDKIFYCTTYNLEINKLDENLIEDWYNNKNKLIYSYNSFINIIDDFDYIKFSTDYPLLKKKTEKEIIHYYINNINNIRNIYSYKYHKIKYNNDHNEIENNLENNITEDFYNKYPDFNINLYKYFNDIKNIDINNIYTNFDYNIQKDCNIIYSTKTFYNFFIDFNINIYKVCNNLDIYNEYELIIHFHNLGLKLNLVYNKDTFNKKYSLNLSDDKIIIDWYIKYIKNNNIIGHQYVNHITEVLNDLENIDKNKLDKGISLIIRAKNEELNIKNCIESVVDLVDEIIFVDNNSTDNTYKLVEEYTKIHDKIKLYKYNINVSKAGIEHSDAIKNSNKNTLGTFYNWCLSKTTKYNVFKWDADFICVRNNFIQLVNIYNLRDREDKFAVWFTGKTLFENNGIYYINDNSFYNEYRIFSYKHGFQWYDGCICEYTEPYLNECNKELKYEYKYPLFFEVKRTSIDEFKERSSLIDSRDINDYNIINSLKNNDVIDLIKLNYDVIFKNNKILIYTPSLSFGGGNQFIINMYNVFKTLGFDVKIIPLNRDKNGLNKFNNLVDEDIIEIPTIDFIKKYETTHIILNSIFPFHTNDLNDIINKTKIIFITHSDVAYSNNYIQKYHNIFHKILTVNNYTITKLSKLLNINDNIFYKISNYINIDNNLICKNIKNKKFGVISRFSEDKNIPMLIYSLINVFNKYPDYKCYLVGTHNSSYDNYLINLCKLNNINDKIIFTGYKDDVFEYYKIFDFIVLPSVSEGCSYNIIEAIGLGIPVVTSNVGGNHELIIDNTNGILYDYNGIRDFENRKVYITSYNKQLDIIGYFINDNEFNNSYTNIFQSNTEVILPFFVRCKKCKKDDNNCLICKNINIKKKIFNDNMKNLSYSIIKMIEMENTLIKTIKNNNIDFFHKNFNKKLYINQLLEIV